MHLSVAFTPKCDRTQRSHKRCGCAAAARCTSVVLTLPGAWKYLKHAWIRRLQPAIKPRRLQLQRWVIHCRCVQVWWRHTPPVISTWRHNFTHKASKSVTKVLFLIWEQTSLSKVKSHDVTDYGLSTIMLFWTKTFFPSCLPLLKLSSSFNWVLFKATEYFRTYQRVSQIKGIYLYQRSLFILHLFRLQQCNDINPLGIYKSSHKSQINKYLLSCYLVVGNWIKCQTGFLIYVLSIKNIERRNIENI